ncbi:MAG: hypothetical protein J0L54_08455 [Chitinophagales bacterium]|nr:hypothetical protein [Chitinophagales bacterium]
MRTLLPYEEIIVKKMEELPVPDREEAVWNSIRADLGYPLPDDIPDEGTGRSDGITVSTGRIVTGIIVSVIIIVITVMVARRKAKIKQHTSPIPVITQPQTPANDSSQKNEPKRNATAPYAGPETSATLPLPANADTSIVSSPGFPETDQSDSNRLSIPLRPAKDTSQNLPGNQPKRKTIGVTGISDSSYRISGKRDSL